MHFRLTGHKVSATHSSSALASNPFDPSMHKNETIVGRLGSLLYVYIYIYMLYVFTYLFEHIFLTPYVVTLA